MSYLVPREIPSDCTKCRWAMCNYPTVYCRLMHKGSDMLMAIKSRPDWCPLIEVKVPHGRLGDLDELKKKVLSWLPSDPCGQEEKEFPFETDICVSMLMEIEDADTIIEAERSEE